MEYFISLDTTVQVAVIGLCGSILVAIITGIFGLIKKDSSSKSDSNSTTVNQISSGNSNHLLEFKATTENGKIIGENTKINQNSEPGSHGNTFIAEQYNGLSVDDAMHMAFSMFREYCPQLREELVLDLQKMLEDRLKSMPPEDIVQPSARIVVPTLQNASITEDIEVRRLYAQLLANSMNKTMKFGVHPAFVEIINQLCSDEAKLLRYLSTHTTVPTVTLRCENEKSEGIDVIKNFSNVGELAGCENPFGISEYFDNLIRLGLIKSPVLSSLTNESLYEPLKTHQYILSKIDSIARETPPFNKPILNEGCMTMTDFGISFCNVCVLSTEKVAIFSKP